MESSQGTEQILQRIQRLRRNPGASVQTEQQHEHEPPKTTTSPVDVENQLLAAGNEPLNKNFNHVLQTWLNSNEHPDRVATRCVEILRHMQGLYRQGHERAIPTLVTYSLVLTAMARTGRARQAETILKELLDAYQEHGNAIQQPNKMHFTAVMDAWAKSSEPNAPEHAWNLLQRMQRMATETNNPDLLPSIMSYNTVLNALAQSRDAPAACALLQDMWTWYEQGNVHAKPILSTYNAVLNALAETGAAVQADRMLLELHTRYSQGDQDVRPNVACYNTVLKAWKNSGADDAPERAMDLLDEMERLATDEQGFDTLPNRVSYTTVVHIWSKRGHKVTSPRIKALLKKRSPTGVAGDISMYNAYLDGLAKAGHCQEAQDLLDELCCNYVAGTSAIKPDVVTFNTVIAAWRPAEKAEAVFRQMMTLGPQLDIAPTVISFTTLITAFVKSKCPDMAERYLQELRTVYATTSDELLRPDRKLYTTVLQAWKLSGDPRALDKCYALVEDLKALQQSGVPNCSPDHMVYNTLLEVIAASPAPDKAERANSILEEMKLNHIRINKFTLDCVLLACARRDPNATLASRERAFSKEVDEANMLRHKLGFSNAALQTRK
jgi:pentatricopeptide repeat protein